MTEATKLETLVHLIAQGRQEDRQDLAELRKDMSDMARSLSKLSNSMTEYMANQKHTDVEIEGIKTALHGDNGLSNRVGHLEVAQAEDKQNWRLVAAISVILFTAVVGYYFSVVKPIQASNLQAEETRQLLEQINGKIQPAGVKP